METLKEINQKVKELEALQIVSKHLKASADSMQEMLASCAIVDGKNPESNIMREWAYDVKVCSARLYDAVVQYQGVQKGGVE